MLAAVAVLVSLTALTSAASDVVYSDMNVWIVI